MNHHLPRISTLKSQRQSRRAAQGQLPAEAGFSLIELQLAIAIGTIVAVAALPIQIRRVQSQIQDLVARQMFTIGEAAQAFRQQQGSWPGDDGAPATPCGDALSGGTPESNLFLTDYYVGGINSGFGAATIAVRCPSANRFEVTTNAPTAEQAQILASKLHTATVSGTVVTTTFPLPSAVPALNGVLHRVAIPGRPELNRMETDIDVNGNRIDRAREITWANGESLLGDDTSAGDHRGTIELGDKQTLTNQGHYIDFHFVPGEDYNIRLKNGYSGLFSGATNDGGFNIVAREVMLGGEDSFGGVNRVYPGDITSYGGARFCYPLSLASYASASAMEEAARGCHIQAGDGFFESKANGVAYSAPNGSYTVGTAGAAFTPEQGGSLELGGSNTTAGVGTPKIDFHYNGLTEDYNVQIVNNLNGVLSLNAARVDVSADLNVARNAVVGKTVQAKSFVDADTGRRLESFLADSGIIEIDPNNDTLVPKPNCPTGLTPRISVAPVSFAAGQSAKPISQVRNYAVDKGSSWDIEMFVLTEDGQIKPEPGYGFSQVIIQCGAS